MKSSNNNHRTKANLIKELISKGRLIKAVKLLNDLCQNDDIYMYKNAILISMETHVLNEDIIGGRVTWEQANQKRSKLANRMLKLIDVLEP